MAVTETLLCMMSAVIATCLLMLCDSAVVKTRSPLYHMNYVTYPPSTTLLTGTPYYFGTYPTMPPMPTRQNYCIRDGKRYSVGESIHTNPCAYCFCAVGGYINCLKYDCNMQYPWCDDYYFENPDDCCVRCPIGKSGKDPEMEESGVSF